MVAVLPQVDAIVIVGGDDDIIAVEMLDNAIILQRHDPAGVLVHTIVDNEDGMAPAQGRLHKYRWIELQYHTAEGLKTMPPERKKAALMDCLS